MGRKRKSKRAKKTKRQSQPTHEKAAGPDGDWSTVSQVQMVSGLREKHSKRTVQETLAAFAVSPWFQAVVRRIANAAASVPWRLYAIRGKRKEESRFVRDIQLQTCMSPEVRTKLLHSAEADGRLVEIVEHPLLELLALPNDKLSGLDMRFVTFASLLVAGEVGWVLGRAAGGRAPVSIWPVPPHWIIQYPTGRDPTYHVRVGGEMYVFLPEEFVVFRNPGLVNPYGPGVGVGVSLTDELETDEYAAKFMNTFFHSRGRPDLVVSVAGGKVKGDLQKQKEAFENKYRDMTRGGGRSLWVRGNDVKITELSRKLVDMEVPELRTWTKDLVRECFGAPPEVMGDVKDSKRSTIREAMAILAILSTVPQLEHWRAQAQTKIVPLFDSRLVLGYESPVPADKEYRLRVFRLAPWAATIREVRSMLGLDDRGQADDRHVMPVGVELVDAPKTPKGRRDVKTHAEVVAETTRKDFSEDEVDRIVRLLTPERLDYEIAPEIERTVEEWGNRVLADVGVAPAFDMLNPLVENFLTQVRDVKLVGINDVTAKRVREALFAGVRSGEGAEGLARILRDQFAMFNDWRAMNIARTEVTASANFGTWGAHKMSGVVQRRGWLAAIGLPNIRPEHEQLNGKIVGVDEPFTIGGYAAMYPGGFGVPEMDCQCRCGTYAVIDEPKSAEWLTKAIKSFIEETDKDERRVALAARRAFDWQRDLLIAELRRVAG